MDIILLAAGMSKRMGRQKLTMPFGASTILETTAANLINAQIGTVYAVFSENVAQKMAHSPVFADVKTAINKIPERGQSSSLIIALEMLSGKNDFCIMLGDQPFVTPDDIKYLYDKFRTMPTDKTLLTPYRDGEFGHPMLYRALWHDRFVAAQGDGGGKNIVKQHENEILKLNASENYFRDLDTMDDYNAAVKQIN